MVGRVEVWEVRKCGKWGSVGKAQFRLVHYIHASAFLGGVLTTCRQDEYAPLLLWFLTLETSMKLCTNRRGQHIEGIQFT